MIINREYVLKDLVERLHESGMTCRFAESVVNWWHLWWWTCNMNEFNMEMVIRFLNKWSIRHALT